MVMLDDRSESNVSLGDLDLTDFDVDVDVDGELDASSRHSLSIISGYGGGENHDSRSTNNSANAGADAGADKKNKNAKQDYESSLYQATKSLLKWRSCILFVWILSSISVSLAAFFYLGHLEQEEFETSYRQSAQLLASIAEDKFQSIRSAWNTESEDITAYTLSTKVQWPYVLMPYWERRAYNLRRSTYTSQITLAPIVRKDIQAWRRFAAMTQDNWIQEGLSIQTERQQEQKEDTYQHYDNEHYETRHLQLMQTEAALQDQTPSSLDTPELALYWQTSPPPETDFDNSLIHCNVLENNITRNLYQNLLVVHDEEHYQYHFHQNDLVMSDLAPDIYYIHTSANTNANINNTDTTESSLQQQTLLMQPIYDSFHRNTRQLAGLLLGTLRWDHLVNDILLTTTSSTPNNGAIPNGMMAVVENTCGSSAIYKYQTTTANGKNKLVNLRQGAKQDDSQPLLSIPSKYRTMGITASFHHYHGDHQQHVTTSMAASSNSTTFHDSRNNPNHKDDCHYSLHFYPSQTMEDAFRSHTPKYAALLLALVFIAFAMVFGVYVHMIQQRYQKIQALAIKASTVISSLFPANVRDRIMESALLPKSSSRSRNKKKDSSRQRGARITDEKIESIVDQKQALSLLSSSSNSPTTSSTDDPAAVMNGDRASSEHLKMLKANAVQSNIYSTKPIADLFPEATVLFADIVGFTAWSSTREPCQVFDLLETIYHTLDEIAKKRYVFKVETVGDCYVAVTGIPVPRKDHAIQMCKFARDCIIAMDIVTKKLEIALGPDTSDLSMRIGLHSGPVTAGVLRGERSRFQLFGDTVNTAARMESNGMTGRIHLSQEVANLLAAFNKENWVLHRDDKIVAKGKGELQTYWLDPMAIDAGSKKKNKELDLDLDLKDDMNGVHEANHPTLRAAMEIEKNHHRENDASYGLLTEREQRLIDWTAEQLLKLLKRIIAKRAQCGQESPMGVIPQARASQTEINVFDEVQECIPLPSWDTNDRSQHKDVDEASVQLHPDVAWQVFDYVTSISTLYRNNPFHNFEHAVHVVLSVTKMLSRIVDPGPNKKSVEEDSGTKAHADNGYGIAPDPLTQFAVVFSALIHDVDHLGVSNAQLVKEKSHLARVYKNQSVAEQNSVNIAWDMLMDPAFSELRNCIYQTEEEFVRFRQLVVNSVMATDIIDKDLKAHRNARWEKAFQKKDGEEITKEDVDRKATIVIEHLIQASDVSHTMQHWHVYRKWNAKLFRELYTAYLKGRMEKDPTTFWYHGEIGFFDFYIIPLAKKLRDCGVFGVSCDEYLSYALQNRNEWEKNGLEVVEELRESVKDLDEKFGKKLNNDVDTQQCG